MQVLESSQGVLVLISRPASKLQPTFPGVSSEGIRYHELQNSSSCARAVHGLSGTSSLSIARECVSTCATAVHTRPSDASDLTCRSAPCRVSCCSGARVTFALVSTFSRLSKKACLVARTRTSAKEHLIVQVVTGALVHVDANPLPSNPKPTQPPTKPPPTTTTTNNIACNNDQILVKNADGTSWCETYAGGECVLASMLIVSSSCRQ